MFRRLMKYLSRNGTPAYSDHPWLAVRAEHVWLGGL